MVEAFQAGTPVQVTVCARATGAASTSTAIAAVARTQRRGCCMLELLQQKGPGAARRRDTRSRPPDAPIRRVGLVEPAAQEVCGYYVITTFAASLAAALGPVKGFLG